MAIHIGKPYRIINSRHKRYATHYNIPSNDCLVVPLREYGNELLCDVRWENENGELHVEHNRMFVSKNIEPLNAMLHEKLYEIWIQYYTTLNTGSGISENALL